MFAATFPSPRVVYSEAELQESFDCPCLYLADGGTVTLEGQVSLAHNVSFAGDCSIGDGTSIDTGSTLNNVRLGRNNRVRPYSVLNDFSAGDGNLLGPFCFIRDDCVVADHCILGAHVEAARSRFGSGVKISHRAFIGDADVADHVIIGAGVVFCNWDGQSRQATRVAAGVTIGSGSLLVPPLAVGEGATIAAGSTLTRDVPARVKVIQKRS
jgi:bifunctional UDP-N-acetylglucosamine pyrophosphorylase/glucosamine-1-phosphate N-acetyltransferase